MKLKLKYILPILAIMPFAVSAAPQETSYISSSSYIMSASAPGTSATTSSSLYYTDGAGRLTNFEMTSENGSMTIRIRQDGAVVWSRTFAEKNTAFAVSRREEQGRVYFLITAGNRRFTAEPNEKGEWTVLPLGENPRVAAL